MTDPRQGTPEDRLAEVEANLAFEGAELTPDERALMLRYLRGEITREEHKALTDELVLDTSPDDDSR